MTAYVETYVVDGSECGIEDMEDGKPADQHFFPDQYRKGEDPRFRLWWNGCGLGRAETLAGAREKLRQIMLQIIGEREDSARQDALRLGGIRSKLITGLQNFQSQRKGVNRVTQVETSTTQKI